MNLSSGDERLRHLERLAAMGDPEAQAALERARWRSMDHDPEVATLDAALESLPPTVAQRRQFAATVVGEGLGAYLDARSAGQSVARTRPWYDGLLRVEVAPDGAAVVVLEGRVTSRVVTHAEVLARLQLRLAQTGRFWP